MDYPAKKIFTEAEKNQNKLKSLCEPLDRHFGTTALCLVYTNNQNKLLNLHTDIPWIEHCLRNKYFLDDPLMSGYETQVAGFQLLESRGTDDYKDGLLKDATDIYDMCNGVSYTKRYSDGVLSICMTTNSGNDLLRSKIFSEYDSLSLFSDYLMEHLIYKLKQSSNAMIDISSLKEEDPDDIRKKSKLENIRELNESRFNFLSSISKVKLPANVRVTNQEKRCIQGVIEGKTVKEVSSRMGLSLKTVENYLKNAKQKLGYKCNRDFIINQNLLKGLNIIY